jgi:hypothetical protein
VRELILQIYSMNSEFGLLKICPRTRKDQIEYKLRLILRRCWVLTQLIIRGGVVSNLKMMNKKFALKQLLFL